MAEQEGERTSEVRRLRRRVAMLETENSYLAGQLRTLTIERDMLRDRLAEITDHGDHIQVRNAELAAMVEKQRRLEPDVAFLFKVFERDVREARLVEAAGLALDDVAVGDP